MSHVLALILTCQPPPALPSVSLDDLRQFPPAAVTRTHRDAVQRNLEQLRLRQCVDTRWQVQEAIDEARESFAAWDALDTALVSSAANERLDALAGLRHLIGPKAYYAGWMPPLSPRWWCPDDRVQHIVGPLR